MAFLLFIFFLLAVSQHVLALRPYGTSPPYPLTYSNATSTVTVYPTATGHHGPLISTTGVPHLPNGSMIDNPLTAASWSADCIYAKLWSPYTFIECLSEQKDNKVIYTISATGTGQKPTAWAEAIFNNAQKSPCSIASTLPWQESNGPDIDDGNNATYNYVIDGWSRRIFQLQGFTMSFKFTGWDSNNCHDVVKDAIRAATCPDVVVANGLACRKKGYYGDNYLPAGSPTYNHPEIGDYDDNNAGPP